MEIEEVPAELTSTNSEKVTEKATGKATEKDDDIIEIPRKLFEELMSKRNELIRLNVALNADSNNKTQQEVIDQKEGTLKNLLQKVKDWKEKVEDKAGNWKNEVLKKADYHENIESLKLYSEGFKVSGKQLFNMTKQGVREFFRISRKLFLALFNKQEE